MKKVALALLLLTILLVPACTSSDSEQYHQIEADLIKTESELAAAQEELRTVQGELNTTKIELNSTKVALENAQRESQSGEITVLPIRLMEAESQQNQCEEQYQSLNDKYEELASQYNAILEGSAEITQNEADIEQSIFQLMNRDRHEHDLEPLVWNEGLYSCARSNNRQMAKCRKEQRSECPGVQQVFWFMGYGSVDRIAEIVMEVWHKDEYTYKLAVFSHTTIGAVAVDEVEGTLYITSLCYTDVATRIDE